MLRHDFEIDKIRRHKLQPGVGLVCKILLYLEQRGRMCLHAKTLGFVHPITGQYLEFDSELPEYFTRFLRSLGKEQEEWNR